MLTPIVAFLFTAILFAFFLYCFVWRNRFATQIRLAVGRSGGRVISIRRQISKIKKVRMETHPDNVLMTQKVEWQIVYKDRDDVLRETRCRPIDGQPHWEPPLS